MRFIFKMLGLTFMVLAFNASATCLNSGTGVTLQNAINNAGSAAVVLCQQAQFAVSDQVNLPNNITIYTEGKPSNSSLFARIYYVTGSGLVGGQGHQAIIAAYARSNVNLSYLTIDGGRAAIQVEPNLDDARKNRTSLAAGGVDTVVDHVRVINTIGSVAISAADDKTCNRITITNSFVGYAGYYGLTSGLGQWADGIGIYCSNSTISNNEIRDVTDGGITFYGGTNTTISSNWIANSGRHGISAIVAAGARSILWADTFYGFSGSQFTSNLIQTGSAMHLHVAISAGSRMW